MSLNDYETIYLNMCVPNKLLRSIALQCFGMEMCNGSIKKAVCYNFCNPEPYCRKIHFYP